MCEAAFRGGQGCPVREGGSGRLGGDISVLHPVAQGGAGTPLPPPPGQGIGGFLPAVRGGGMRAAAEERKSAGAGGDPLGRRVCGGGGVAVGGCPCWCWLLFCCRTPTQRTEKTLVFVFGALCRGWQVGCLRILCECLLSRGCGVSRATDAALAL